MGVEMNAKLTLVVILSDSDEARKRAREEDT